jgi:hypothetical protein
MKSQKLKPIACVLLVSLLLAGCGGGSASSTTGGSSNAVDAAKPLVNNTDHAAFIEMVKKAPQGPVNYEVLNRQFYESKEVMLAFDPNAKPVQSVNGKSLKEAELETYEEFGLAVASGMVAFVPVIGPFLSFAVDQWGDDLLNEYKANPPTEFNPNSMAQQMAKLQYKVASLERSMEKNNNEFYLAIKKLSQQSKDTKQYLLFKAMADLSSAPNTSANAGCKLTNEDFIAKYFSTLGMEGFGTDCAGDVPKVSFMNVAKNLSSYMAINKNTTQQNQYASALEDVSAAKVPLGYRGDFSTVEKISQASDSMLIQVLDSMYTQLENDVPQQGKAGSNYVERINQYNQSLMFILQSAYNSLQGAYSIEQTNNYLNFLAAVNAYQNKVTNFKQIDGYEGNSAIAFKVATNVVPTDYKSLEDDYVNKQNNLQMLFAARANIMFNTVMQHIVSDKPLISLSLPALPTQYNVNGKTYPYEADLPGYSKMYPTPHRTSELSRLPAGNWKESSVLYSWNGYSNYYVCNGVNGSNSEKNCALNPPAESGFYDGDKLSVKILAPAPANLPESLKKAPTISTDWYVGSLNMPFKLSNCGTPNINTVDINPDNGSLYCSEYKKWEPAINTSDLDSWFDSSTRSSRRTPTFKMDPGNSYSSPKYFAIYGQSFQDRELEKEEYLLQKKKYGGWFTDHVFATDADYQNGSDGLFVTDSKFRSYNEKSYHILGDKVLTDAKIALPTSNFFTGNYVLLTDISGYSISDGADLSMELACANDSDGKTSAERYTANSMIQPGYLSCYTIKQGKDDDIYKKYQIVTSVGGWFKYFPAMIIYNGSDYFELYSIGITANSSFYSTEAYVRHTKVSCSDYPQYCKAD